MKTAENAIFKSLSSLDRTLGFIMRNICIVCLVFLLLLLTGNVFFRFVTIISMGWYDEIVELLFAWLVLASVLLLTKSGFV